MASKSPPKSPSVRGRSPGALEGVASKRWTRLERVAQALRSLGDTPMTQARAERLAARFGVHLVTIYRYRARLGQVDEATAIAGRTRGWKPLASRLSVKQEQSIGEAINALRKKAGPTRLVDLVEEVAARCRLLGVPCPSRPAIDRRLKRSSALMVHRRGHRRRRAQLPARQETDRETRGRCADRHRRRRSGHGLADVADPGAPPHPAGRRICRPVRPQRRASPVFSRTPCNQTDFPTWP